MVTERLALRPFRLDDSGWFAELNAEPEVARYLGDGRPLDRAQSDGVLRRIIDHWRAHGFGLWAAERRHDFEPIGFIGLSVPTFLVEPEVEVGWRLATRAWGHGFATEGARAGLEAGFTRLAVDRIISVTVHDNVRSRKVMAKLGLTWDRFDVHATSGLPLEVRSLDRATWAAREGVVRS